MLSGKRILIVDDSEPERMLMSTYLESVGCRVFQASDGIDGINKARLILPDLIFMDGQMPRCDGYAACKILAQEPQTAGIPIIFLSAHSEPERRVQGLLAGAVDYIGKPFNFDEVLLRAQVHLRSRGGVAASATASSESAGPLHTILFHAARVHLLADLKQAPDLQKLARLVGTNTKRLNEAFKVCAGVTVFDYLREERMREARQLLGRTSLPIAEIACRVGYRTSANFATAFKERFGLSPSHYRQNV